MNLVEIDIVRLESLERFFALGDDVPPLIALCVRILWIRPSMNLRGQDDVLPHAVALEHLADNLLALTLRVDVRRIDEIDSALECIVEDRHRLVLVGRPTEHHRTEGELAYTDAGSSEVSEFHVVTLSPGEEPRSQILSQWADRV